MIRNKVKIILNIVLLLATILADYLIKTYNHTHSGYLIFLFGSLFIWSAKTTNLKLFLLGYAFYIICLVMLVVSAIYDI